MKFLPLIAIALVVATLCWVVMDDVQQLTAQGTACHAKGGELLRTADRKVVCFKITTEKVP